MANSSPHPPNPFPSYYSRDKDGRDKRNNILQKALTMYIGEHCGAVKFRNANVSLLAAKEKGSFDSYSYSMQFGSTAEQLKAYTVTTVPPKDEWVDIDEGVKFREVRECVKERKKIPRRLILAWTHFDRISNPTNMRLASLIAGAEH